MLKKESSILREWLGIVMYLIGATLQLLMGSLAILSYLLVVCIVATRESVGQMLIKVKGYVLSNMPEVLTTWLRLLKNLMLKR
jgi:hypothetical protein